MNTYINILFKSLQSLTNWVLSDVFKVIIIIFSSYFIKNILDVSTDKLIEKSKNRRLLTIKQVSHSAITFTIATIALIMILHHLGFDTTPLLAGASIIGVSFGLGLQHSMKDLISGFYILLEDQFVVGDKIKVGEVIGIIDKITLKSTTIKDLEGNLHIVSNGSIEKVTVLKNKG